MQNMHTSTHTRKIQSIWPFIRFMESSADIHKIQKQQKLFNQKRGGQILLLYQGLARAIRAFLKAYVKRYQIIWGFQCTDLFVIVRRH